jgi:hypothetical protein
LLILSITELSAETLKGTVLNAKTKEPLAGVSVYLEGTTIGDATDLNGKFTLEVKSRVYTKLVISSVGYESVVISNPFESLPEIIYLKEKDNALDEIVVTGKPTFTAKQKMKAFKEQFLGTTRAGNVCKILNEEVIRLVYDPEENTLHAYASAPIKIENKHLGYIVEWELIKFTLSLHEKKKSLDNSNADSLIIMGVGFFKPFKKNVFISQNRKSSFDISQRRFFQLLAEDALDKSLFKIFKNDGVTEKTIKEAISSSKYFKITDKSIDNQVTTIALDSVQKDKAGIIRMQVIQFSRPPSVSYGDDFKKKTIINSQTNYYSKMYFSTDTFKVDKYGNTDLNNKLTITGDMGNQRIGDMLPFDYLPQ